MTQQYAAQQPEGFVNHINTIAIIGVRSSQLAYPRDVFDAGDLKASGQIDKIFTKHIVKSGKHVVTAINRTGSFRKFPDGVKTVTVDYDDESSLVSALQGQDFLVITMSLAAAPDTQSTLIKAAAKAGVPHVMPNAYSIDFYDSNSLPREVGLRQVSDIVQALYHPIPKVVD